MSHRSVIYLGTLLTGLTGLTYQVVWQKYLTFIVGSESRSVALVVAVFLGGLAAGYRYWGTLSERIRERRRLLRIYGLIELGIGIYAGLFPFFFILVRGLSHRAPSSLVTDLLITLVTVLLPTFMMGATIPLLVSVVPQSSEEVHLCHARIYGINTLGACLGAFGASFFLIPRVGLPGALWIGCAINVVVGTVFLLNRLEGSITEKEPIEPIKSRFPVRSLYFYTLVTGTVTLSFEVLFVRVLNLTIGPGPHNFAIVVGVFIFGLALGSLLLTARMLSVSLLLRAASFLTIYLVVLYYSVPYWPYWLNNARALLADLPVNYHVYLGVVTGFLLLVLLPFLIPLGFMLPLVYGLLPKDTENYGRECGRLYFFNTIGTALGAIVLSHLALYFIDLDTVFKLDVLLLAALAVYLLGREARRGTAALVIVVVGVFLLGPAWNRDSHYMGLYPYPGIEDFNFQGVFQLPRVAPPDILYFKDGPDATVTVTEYPVSGSSWSADPRARDVQARALIINGKGDGATVEDYSTITLAAMLPYLHAPHRQELNTAVIGLGTGITAAVLAGAEDVAKVTVVEISSSLVDAAPAFDPDNHGLSGNPKVELLALDGFKYFTRLDEELDIVVSATSPPWVTGVENLFTPEFYRLAHRSLADDGVFMQWFPLYTMDKLLLHSIVSNLAGVFADLRLYAISPSEFGILASKQPLADLPDAGRFDEPFMREVADKMYLTQSEQLPLLQLYGAAELRFLAEESPVLTHTMDRPSLAYANDRVRFLGLPVDWREFVDSRVRRMTAFSETRLAAFRAVFAAHVNGMSCPDPYGRGFFCEWFEPLRRAQFVLASPGQGRTVADFIGAYDQLRDAGVLAADPDYLGRLTEWALLQHPTRSPEALQAVEQVVLTYVKDGLWDGALRDLARYRESGLIDPGYHDRLVADVQGARGMYSAFARRLGKS